ncbi:TPA: peptidase M23 [Vibrio vulnificus]|uniref:peptidoglycan DD-metalloendopeptidase family protein n=1 Tax=Vibrio vulnificus TaxID=672 RepID=UPI001A31FF67|nr:peptidoglycan DD-metalloendopeptidase family protein [Vibrio vulnificus]EGR0207050.1 peptidoglycan DD-metalloendopeptidase family protein [Vibrio vulnificus]EHH3081418.1 peptidoglycan DD-metalloendopeptidase family protein [Vibrio vulnificus]EHK8986258.1 peptidoglycan DD-metalloendopeptidase family protein [Vibrio vulnificus]EHZ2655596.1 peptidoglycan DD-metalloendopeptidase family protein [Vibrio vulnificus]EIZ1006819.1 peptidoglycan DD-metalloendopeptidase family protein [Vibrio vulnificu
MTSLILRQYTQSIALPFVSIAFVIIVGVSFTYYLPQKKEQDQSATKRLQPIVFKQIKYNDIKHTDETYFQSEKIITGVIDYSFVSSLIKAGLSQHEIRSLIKLIENEFDIIGSVQKGDKFSIKTKINNHNEIYISSFYYSGSKKDFFVISDGNNNAYDEYGNKLIRRPYYAFPLAKKYKVSSEFNLKRQHPVTGFLTPHLGTDYAVPIGTPTQSIADGIVVKSSYNRFAGNYINIRHSNGSLSRYLHLSRSNVAAGDHVTKGQIIGLTGNTGRTTGPHLHLELIVDGVPVDYARYIQTNPAPPVSTQMRLAARTERAELIKELHKYAS